VPVDPRSAHAVDVQHATPVGGRHAIGLDGGFKE
jgi:hypothetical protein